MAKTIAPHKKPLTDEDEEFMRRRANILLMETVDGSRDWRSKSSDVALTRFHISAPEDGENYDVWMRLVKKGSNGNQGYLLISHETGLFERDYELGSNRCEPVEKLGKLVFG